MAKLNPIFFTRLKQMCKRLGINPADALLVFYSESGLNPGSITKDTVGLNQFWGNNYKKYFSGTKEQFAALEGEDQLPAIESFLRGIIRNNKIISAAHLYAYNYLPVMGPLIKDNNPNFILAKEGDYRNYPGDSRLTFHAAYVGNKSLDANKDGVITYGDLENKLLSRSREKAYQDALAQLNAAEDNVEDSESSSPETEEDKVLSDFIDRLNQGMESIKSSLAENERNGFLVKISSDCSEDSIELSRILSTAYEDFLGVKCHKFAEDNNVEIYFINNGDKNKCFAAVEQFSNVVLEEFSNKIDPSNLKLKYFTNKKPSYNSLDLKTSEINYRKFALKVIGNKNG